MPIFCLIYCISLFFLILSSYSNKLVEIFLYEPSMGCMEAFVRLSIMKAVQALGNVGISLFVNQRLTNRASESERTVWTSYSLVAPDMWDTTNFLSESTPEECFSCCPRDELAKGVQYKWLALPWYGLLGRLCLSSYWWVNFVTYSGFKMAWVELYRCQEY